MSQYQVIVSSGGGGGGGTVTNVSGTTNRITVANPTTTPVIDISAAYVGQTSLTTLGTVTSGTWNGTAVGVGYGGTALTATPSNGQLAIGNGSGYALATLTAGTGISVTNGSGTISIAATNAGTVTSVSGTANRISSTGGATPVIDIDAAYVGQTSITTLGTVSTGTWSATAIGVSKGGTALTATPTNGQLPIGNGTNYTLATITAGTGVTVTNGSGSITVASTGFGGWVEETGATRSLTVNQRVIGNRSTAQTFTLPTTAALGDEIQIIQSGAGAITIAQNASQQINWGASSTTAGTGGSLTSPAAWSRVDLVCVTTNNIWVARGNPTWTTA